LQFWTTRTEIDPIAIERPLRPFDFIAHVREH